MGRILLTTAAVALLIVACSAKFIGNDWMTDLEGNGNGNGNFNTDGGGHGNGFGNNNVPGNFQGNGNNGQNNVGEDNGRGNFGTNNGNNNAGSGNGNGNIGHNNGNNNGGSGNGNGNVGGFNGNGNGNGNGNDNFVGPTFVRPTFVRPHVVKPTFARRTTHPRISPTSWVEVLPETTTGVEITEDPELYRTTTPVTGTNHYRGGRFDYEQYLTDLFGYRPTWLNYGSYTPRPYVPRGPAPGVQRGPASYNPWSPSQSYYQPGSWRSYNDDLYEE